MQKFIAAMWGISPVATGDQGAMPAELVSPTRDLR